MPATSKAQQRLMGLVKAVQAGDVPKSKVTKKIRQMAKDMKEKSEQLHQEDIQHSHADALTPQRRSPLSCS